MSPMKLSCGQTVLVWKGCLVGSPFPIPAHEVADLSKWVRAEVVGVRRGTSVICVPFAVEATEGVRVRPLEDSWTLQEVPVAALAEVFDEPKTSTPDAEGVAGGEA